MTLIENTKRVNDIDVAHFDALFVAGSQGPGGVPVSWRGG
jgi:putative intracellular protease/amidase